MSSTDQDGEVREMRNAETVLGSSANAADEDCRWSASIDSCSTRTCTCSPTAGSAATPGRMTPGATAETVDGMSPGEDRCHHRRRCASSGIGGRRCGASTSRRKADEEAPARASRPGRTSCCKRSSGSILEAYYEPQFSDHSHGFRPGRGCHTALRESTATWKGTSLVHRG